MSNMSPVIRMLLVVLLLVGTVMLAQAAAPFDRYADGVQSSGILTLYPQRAIGAPDQQVATIAGALGQDLVLDMGAGEEGTGDLIVHYRGVGVSLNTTVQFLDASQTPIATRPLTLVGVNVACSTVRRSPMTLGPSPIAPCALSPG